MLGGTSIIQEGMEASVTDKKAMVYVGKALGPITAGLLLGLFRYVNSSTIIASVLVAVMVTFHAVVRDLG